MPITCAALMKSSLRETASAVARAGVPAFCLQCLRDSQVGCVTSATSRPVAFCKTKGAWHGWPAKHRTCLYEHWVLRTHPTQATR